LLSDEQVIRNVLKGDRDGYCDLVERHQGVVYRLAYRILNRAEDAEDVAQEAFIQAFSNLSKCRDSGKFVAWVRRIAVNLCMARIPREIPSEDVERISDAEMAQDDPVQAEVFLRIERERVRTAVSSLSVTHRTVIILRYEEDLSYNEIAEALHEPVSSIQVRLHRAKKMLARRLAVIEDDM
jgi:RNA polymerase sigma-70 factor, ECF subfamily